MNELEALYGVQKTMKQKLAEMEGEPKPCDACRARSRVEEGLRGIDRMIECIRAEVIPTFGEYQEDVLRTQNLTWTRKETVTHALRELASEVGELNGIFQKEMQGHEVHIEDVSEEVGDVLWGLGELCNALGLHLGIIARDNMTKRMIRYPEGFSAEDSIARRDHV